MLENADRKSFDKSWEQKKEIVVTERNEAYIEFIRQMPDSPVSIEAIQSLGGFAPNPAKLNILFESLTESVRNSPSGKEYKKIITELSQTTIEAIAPNFT